MNIIENLLNQLDALLGSAAYFPIVLLGVGLFFTVYLGVPQLRFFAHAWQVLTGRFAKDDDPGDTSHFQALSTALSGTVGTGNIGGVAFAIYLGGPAALFWMWMTALIGMTTKFAEVTISHRYRTTDSQGRIAGGPMYYMEKGLNMKGLAIFFAIATVISSFGTGSLPQSNNMASGLASAFDIPEPVSGAVFAVLLALVILGGIRRIAKVAAAIVPLMGVLYAIGALAVVLSNLEQLGPAFISVFSDAFSGSAAAGGFLGASFAYAFNRGVNRGLYSNEAGQGSAPIAHAAARTKEPVAEGMVAILEPFIDTLIICTLTGMVILSSGVWAEKFHTSFASFDTDIVAGQYSDQNPAQVAQLFAHLSGQSPRAEPGSKPLTPIQHYSGDLQVRDGWIAPEQSVTVIHNRSVAEQVRVLADNVPFTGTLRVEQGQIQNDTAIQLEGRSLLHSVPLTIEAFKRSMLGEWGQYIVSVGLALFAFSTALAWSYYGDRAVTYLVGVSWILPYRLLYVIGFFLATIADTSLIWLLSAITLALMTLPNLIGLLLMRKEIRSLTERYWNNHQQAEADRSEG